MHQGSHSRIRSGHPSEEAAVWFEQKHQRIYVVQWTSLGCQPLQKLRCEQQGDPKTSLPEMLCMPEVQRHLLH